MSQETLFSQIINHELPADIVYQDDDVCAFRDIAPKAPTHILIVPTKVIASINEAEQADEQLLGKLFTVARKLAKQEGIDQSGYRLIINNGPDSGQIVFHLHMHLLGGRPLGHLVD